MSGQLWHFKSMQSLAEIVNINSSISVHVQLAKQLFDPASVGLLADMRANKSGRFDYHNDGR